MNEYDISEYSYKNGYADGVKEFAERLRKSRYGWYDWNEKEIVYAQTDIDNFVKEMVGDS